MKKLIAIFTAVALLVLGGCAPTMIKKDNLHPATYCMENEKYPLIDFFDDETFLMSFTVMDNILIEGTYEMPDENTVKLTAYDGAEYFFDVDVENEALIFDAEISSEFIKVPEKNIEILDGTKFVVWHYER